MENLHLSAMHWGFVQQEYMVRFVQYIVCVLL